MLGAYSTFSWLLYRSNLTWQSWLIVLVLALVQAFLLTTLSRGLQLLVGSWLKSDLGYFSVVLIGGLLAVFALAWLQIFGHITVLIASEVLARIDLRRAGYSSIQALVILAQSGLQRHSSLSHSRDDFAARSRCGRNGLLLSLSRRARTYLDQI